MLDPLVKHNIFCGSASARLSLINTKINKYSCKFELKLYVLSFPNFSPKLFILSYLNLKTLYKTGQTLLQTTFHYSNSKWPVMVWVRFANLVIVKD